VLVNDGETIVLGGIFDDFKSNQYRKVPFLGDLPVVGNLFKNNTKISEQAELLIFVTPRIVNDSVSRNH
ncbi:type IV pilus secretin PilQ, partial [Acinetobacter baumannii]